MDAVRMLTHLVERAVGERWAHSTVLCLAAHTSGYRGGWMSELGWYVARSERPGFSLDPSDFRLYVPRLLSVAWGRPMADLTGQRLDCWDPNRSQLSLLLTKRLAIGKSGEIATQKWKRRDAGVGVQAYYSDGERVESPRGLSWWPCNVPP